MPPHLKSLRLAGYDYTRDGAYFVTICTHNRLCLFGDVIEDKMHLNEAGRMLEGTWYELSDRFSPVRLDAFTIMPNHLHGIIIIENGDFKPVSPRSRMGMEHVILGKGALFTVDLPTPRTPTRGVPTAITFTKGMPTDGCVALSDVIGTFKSITTVNYIAGVKQNRWSPFHYKLWQADYFDRIIRSSNELCNIRNYIVSNPLRWTCDRENPDRRLIS